MDFEKQLSPAIEKQSLRDNLKNVRVLIVDDNAANRKILLSQTAAWGMIALEAESGLVAHELLERAALAGKPFDLAILDLMMPEMDGFELVKIIKDNKITAGTNLILMPSHGRRGHGQTARENGIAGYLTKPVKQTDLFNCIAAVLGETTTPVSTKKSMPLVTRHTLEENRLVNKARILADGGN